MCTDMREVWKEIESVRYEIPNVDDIIQHLNGTTVFSKLDLNMAYHQVELQ
jgi:hypothetical protein